MQTISATLLRHLAPLLFSGLFASGLCNAQPSDLLPLKKGLQYHYAYDRYDDSWNLSNYAIVTDSGRVEISVMDSLLANDSTIIWQILEKRDLVHHWQYNYRAYDTSYSRDSVYFLRDTSTTLLVEMTAGYHELRGTSSAWLFPAFAHSDQTLPIFRYSDSSAAILSVGSYYTCRFADANYDSLWFSADSGLYKRIRSVCNDMDEIGEASWQRFNLLTRVQTAVSGEGILPTTVHLLTNYPNPFNPATTIVYDLAKKTEISLTVCDLLGRVLVVLSEGVQMPGRHEVSFDASHLASGIYLARLRAPHSSSTIKMLLLR